MKILPQALTILASFALAGAGYAQLTEQQAASGQFRIDDTGTAIKPAAEPHFAAARKAAGTDWLGPLALCNQARPKALKWDIRSPGQLRAQGLAGAKEPEPARIFDNLYYLGIGSVSAYAVATRDGIVVIDTLNNKTDASNVIEAGLRKFGLDPATIKYIIVTHGHGDHYGGAAYLASKYKARVMMSDNDWTLSPTTLDKPYFDAAPPRDLVITDGQKLTLGGETLTLRITPGHTPGTVSVLIPVTDNGKRHMAALWGGVGFNFPHSPPRFEAYAASAERFAGLARAAGADVVLQNHPENDNTFFKLRALRDRKPDAANPFVVGSDGVERFFTTLSQCALAYGAQYTPPV